MARRYFDRNVNRISFTFGIEEEYLLVHTDSRDLATRVPDAFIRGCKTRLGKRFTIEYMRAQIEVCTTVCRSMARARDELVDLRRTVAELAGPHGLAPIAASTHPFARWERQQHNDTPRYNEIAEDLQGLGRRMVVNGLHVHVGIDDAAARIEVMNGLRPFLPILLALSASSPFWQGENTGLASYRTAINDATPRKGMPERFACPQDYARAVRTLIRSGVIEDASKVWWDLRPSTRYPTLEMRITDACPSVADGLCIAAIYKCLCRYLMRIRAAGGHCPDGGTLSMLLINENRWRAQRYGIREGLIDWRKDRMVAFPTVVEELLTLIAEDADALDCAAEVAVARRIVRRGTSADRQLECYKAARKRGISHAQALVRVVDQLIRETVAEPEPPVVEPASQRRRHDAVERLADPSLGASMRTSELIRAGAVRSVGLQQAGRRAGETKSVRRTTNGG